MLKCLKFTFLLFACSLFLNQCSKQTSPETHANSQDSGEPAFSTEDVNAQALDEFFGDIEPTDSLPKELDLDDHHLVKTYNWRMPRSDFPIEINDRVLSWMEYFTGRGRPIFSKWLVRKANVEALILQTLQHHEIPEDLIYLAMIESGFNPKAYSRARASGPWQFIASTGRRYGLHSNYWIDERRDPIKSTDAAARHLRDLYEEFGDWHLAAAAYNAGSGKVKRAIKRHKKTSYWDLINVKRPYLRAETRNYVPKMIAALIIGKQPQAFGFEYHPALPMQTFEKVTIDDAADLRVLAKAANTELNELRKLNPEIRLWFTPPVKKYELRLPEGKKEGFVVAFAKIPPQKRVTFRHHRVRQGETLGHLARRYRTSTGSIMRMNGIRNPRRLRIGTNLVIPVRKSHATYVAKSRSKRTKPKTYATASIPSGHVSKKIVVRKGDTLWSLANQHEVNLHSLRKWNALHRSTRIYPGDTLTIYIKNKDA